MLKSCNHDLQICIINFLNLIIKSEVIPSQWLTGYITPIHKGGAVDDLTNYRGISITSVAIEVFNMYLVYTPDGIILVSGY